jgi:hypothetical protein
MSKKRELQAGWQKAGPFEIHLHTCVFNETPFEEAEFLEAYVHERSIDFPEFTFYTHLVNDERFKLFSTFGSFDRRVSSAELVEYNTYVERKEMCMPTWKLSKGTIHDLIDSMKKMKGRKI